MRYLLILLVMMFANAANAIDCQTPPDCVRLGYATENDPNCAANGYVYCPFDENYKKCVNYDCEALGFTEDDKTSWCTDIVHCKGNDKMTLCNCLKPRCNIGDVYYADGSCGDVKDYTEDKVAVGVVYDTNCAGGGKVINLKDLGKSARDKPFDQTNPYALGNVCWGYMNYNVPDLADDNEINIVDRFKAYDPALYNGQGNTAKILAAPGPTDCHYTGEEYYGYCIPEVARAAHDFYPLEELKDDSRVGQGKWYMPALGELMELYGYDNSQITDYTQTTGATGETKTIVNNTLKALMEKGVNAGLLGDSHYFSSSEYNDDRVWIFLMTTGSRLRGDKKKFNRLRVSLEF